MKSESDDKALGRRLEVYSSSGKVFCGKVAKSLEGLEYFGSF